MMRLYALTLAVALAAASAACDETLKDIAGPTPNLQPTFTTIQQEVFNTTDSAGRSLCVGCHSDQGRAASAGLVLLSGRSYQSLVGIPSNGKPGAIRVIPGDPSNSYLVQKLEGTQGIVGQRMPRTGGPYLTPGQLSILRRWIQLGAKND